MVRRADIRVNEYGEILGDSDDENTGDIEGGSLDIDFDGIEDSGESDEGINDEAGNKGAAEVAAEVAAGSNEEETWTAELSQINVADFSAISRTMIDIIVDPKADNFFLHSCLKRIFFVKSWWKRITMLVIN